MTGYGLQMNRFCLHFQCLIPFRPYHLFMSIIENIDKVEARSLIADTVICKPSSCFREGLNESCNRKPECD
jgi:hypothetical protein